MSTPALLRCAKGSDLNRPLILGEPLDPGRSDGLLAHDMQNTVILPARLLMQVEADEDTDRGDAFGSGLTNEAREPRWQRR